MTETTPRHRQPEMHPQRWGDPARAAGLPDSARGLVELAQQAGDDDAGALDAAAHVPAVDLDDPPEVQDRIANFAGHEGLHAHAKSVTIRFEEGKK